MPRPRELDVYGYLDYRAYLRDFYETKKAAGRGFSFRSFSKRAGLKSPNYLKLV
ncbi:MAG: TIGR02147 family protein, partial [Sandaracinus sp.]|nr:TIGR02147 family protein [Sandaracinus sp.]